MVHESSKKTVLVIDDDPTLRLLLSDCLEELDYKVVTAETGVEGFDIATRITPDLIMLDVMLPYADGFDICGELGMHSRTARVPVVIMTGRKDARAATEGLEAGAVDFLSKPIDWDSLPEKIERALAAGQAA